MKNLAVSTALLLCAGSTTVLSFAPAFVQQHQHRQRPSPHASYTTALSAGGFEWEDPVEQFDQGVENPFKNPEILEAGGEGSEEGMKIDPARLLGPRLQGSNLYFIGMMGSGKSAVGDIVARSEFFTYYVSCGILCLLLAVGSIYCRLWSIGERLRPYVQRESKYAEMKEMMTSP